MKSNIEHWKDVPNYEGLYQVSNLGRVKSLKFGKDKILKPQEGKRGYMKVGLWKEGERKYSYVHRLIMLAFVGESDLQVNHKNGVKTDNCLENLEYCTASENTLHAYDTGLMIPTKGEKTVIQRSQELALSALSMVIKAYPKKRLQEYTE